MLDGHLGGRLLKRSAQGQVSPPFQYFGEHLLARDLEPLIQGENPGLTLGADPLRAFQGDGFAAASLDRSLPPSMRT